ncbi:phospholipase-like protein [Tanacetum coccineum]|uniref:Phospholipase-like protein n=1 Tax=Tanacetum coccineum TaxID=301880 RepID=A0ABQ4YKB8_9ASTR
MMTSSLSKFQMKLMNVGKKLLLSSSSSSAEEDARSSLKNVLMYEALLSFFVTDIPLVSSEVDSFVMFLTKSEGSRRLNRVFIVMLQHSYTFPLNTAISGSVTFTAALDHQMEQMLSEVVQSPSETMIKVLHHLHEALFAKELLRHPDMNVNISVACCICEIMRIMAPDSLCSDDQMKDFFEMVVITFEKLSFAYGGCYTKMTKVLRIFCNIRLAVLMLYVQVEGLICRLFKQFLTVADSNSSAIVLKMEKIMTMIIEESEERAPKLQALIVASLKKDNQIASPVGWQLGEKVLMNWTAKLKPGLLNMGRDMSIALYDYSKMVSLMRKAALESRIMDPKALGEHIPTTTNNIKQECLEEGGNMVQTIRNCQLGSSDTVNTKGTHPKIEPKHEMTTLSISGDPPMPSKSVTRVNGKRKRYTSPWKRWPKSAEHGENLVGSRVRVWWPADRDYYEGVVDSFDCSKKKHKILYDDGDEDVLDLRLRKWMRYQDVSDTPESVCIPSFILSVYMLYTFLRFISECTNTAQVDKTGSIGAFIANALGLFGRNSISKRAKLNKAGQEVPQKFSSPQSSVICVHGYKVKESVAPVLESIFKKYGDIAENCSFKTDSIRASFLEFVCDVVKQIQTNELIVTREEIECKVSDAEAANINVSWLRAHLEDMKKNSSSLMEMKENII